MIQKNGHINQHPLQPTGDVLQLLHEPVHGLQDPDLAEVQVEDPDVLPDPARYLLLRPPHLHLTGKLVLEL